MMLEQIKLLMPEIIIATGICTMVLSSSIKIISSKLISQIIAAVTLMAATASAIFLLPSESQYLFDYQVIIDPLTSGLRISSYVIVLIVIFGTDVNEKINQNELSTNSCTISTSNITISSCSHPTSPTSFIIKYTSTNICRISSQNPRH